MLNLKNYSIETDRWLRKEINIKLEELTNLELGEGINKSIDQLKGEILYLVNKSKLQDKEFNKIENGIKSNRT